MAAATAARAIGATCAAVSALLAHHAGAHVATQEIRDRFDAAFGPGAGARVQFRCTGDGERLLIQEAKVALKDIIAEGVSVADLIRNADPVSIGCPGGIIDPAGLQ